MQVNDAFLETSGVKSDHYPKDNLPEIALLGRSNVGKSSFINRLIERTKLARTSSQPGKTQTLNFYQINNKFRFVDVPGYGYARVSKSDRKSWKSMIDNYLRQRENLELVFILMDIRHEPSKLDIEMYHYLDSLEIPFAIILTKLDKIKKNQLNKHLSAFKTGLELPTVDALFLFSSETGEGGHEIWDVVESIIED